MRRTYVHAALAAWLLTALPAGAAATSSFYPADPLRGRSLAVPCLACHGAAASLPDGQPFPTPKLGGQRPDSIYDALLDYKRGARNSVSMTAMAAALSDQDMRDIAAYLAGAQVKPSPAPVAASAARTRVHMDCAACHGETGLGVMPGYPIIGGQYADYLTYALRAYQSGARSNPTMRTMAATLSNAEIQELAQFFAERDYLRVAQ